MKVVSLQVDILFGSDHPVAFKNDGVVNSSETKYSSILKIKNKLL